MQARLLDLFVRFSQKEGEPNEVGSQPSSHWELEDRRLSDASFANLLKDIDSFNLELAQQASAKGISETQTGLPLPCGPGVGETKSFSHP